MLTRIRVISKAFFSFIIDTTPPIHFYFFVYWDFCTTYIRKMTRALYGSSPSTSYIQCISSVRYDKKKTVLSQEIQIEVLYPFAVLGHVSH